MKWAKNISWAVSFLLILLWVYTALSKVADIEVFVSPLSRQPEPVSTLAPMLVWVLPLVELVAATMLMFAQTRKSGLLLSFFLMLAFTGYVALAVIGYWEDIPCSCGGVLNRLGWKDHLWFNLFFLIIAALGLAAERHLNRSNIKGATCSRPPLRADRPKGYIRVTGNARTNNFIDTKTSIEFTKIKSCKHEKDQN